MALLLTALVCLLPAPHAASSCTSDETSLLTHGPRHEHLQRQRPRSHVSDKSVEEAQVTGLQDPDQASLLAPSRSSETWKAYWAKPPAEHKQRKNLAGSGGSQFTKLKKLLGAVVKREKELSKLTGAVNGILFPGNNVVDDGLASEEVPQSITITGSTVYGNVIGGNSGLSHIGSDLRTIGNSKNGASFSSGDSITESGNSQRNQDIDWHHDVSMPMNKENIWSHDVDMPVNWHHDVAMPMTKDIDWHHDVFMPTKKDNVLSHDVYMPVGNTQRSFGISAGDTQWRHDVFMPIGNTKKTVDVSANGTNIHHRVDTDLFDKASHRLGEIASSRLGGSGAGTDNGGEPLDLGGDGLGDTEFDANGNSTSSP
ncbi:unnamed protein product [Symbiodinium microadriaticum]|nr:unnamed protein product [Symbiodinium microadriaticum]CAE7727182.1 unnamed protein product [Symbiodinium sp. KB8]